MSKKRILSTILTILVILLLGIVTSVYYISETVQFKEIGEEYLKVFNTNFIERVGIFSFTAISAYIIIMLTNIGIRKGLKEHFSAESKELPKLPNNSASIIMAIVLGLAAQYYLSGQILNVINMGFFGKKDAIFHMDYSYFIMAIPVIQTILKMILVFLGILSLYIVGYYIIVINSHLDGIEFKGFKSLKMVKQLINVIIAGTVIVITYNFLSHQDILIGDMLQRESVKGSYLTGAGFLDVNIKLWAYRIISVVIIIAVYNFIKGIKKEESKKILFSIILVPATLIVIFVANIAIDTIFLRGNDIDREKEYILANIRATEEAYNINIENKEITKGTDITSEKIKKDAESIEKLPIITSDVVKETLENNTDNKEKKSLYKYGTPNLVKNGDGYEYLTPREIDYKDKTTTNKIYKYTHGNFGILTSASKVKENGYLLNTSEKFEGQELNGIKVKEPRLYYGENTSSNAIVNAKDVKEYDYPLSTLTNKENSYDGKGGIKLNLLERIAVALTKGSTELLFNNNITENTKILLNKQIIERARKILPNIRYDKDPYLVVKEDGGLAWVIDGYTVTSRYPYSQKVSIEADKGGKERINFIRNSVKVVVDAYNGNVEFYVTDTTDPFIATIMKTYPTLLKNYSELSDTIKKQMKYPQYLFDIQAKVLTTYHNSDVDNIYRADDRWEVTEVSGSGARSSISMYTVLKEENDLKPAIITTYTPEKRKNIVSYLVGYIENGVNKLTMYRYNEKSEFSLSFIDSQIEKDTKVQKEMRELTTLGTELKTVRILLPYENTTLYIKTIYQVFLNEDAVPVLKKVIVANKGKVGIGNTLKEAMQKMLTENAIDIDVRDLANEDELKDAIIKQNKILKDVIKQGDFEYTGKDMQKLINLVDQLEEVSKEKKKTTNTEKKIN